MTLRPVVIGMLGGAAVVAACGGSRPPRLAASHPAVARSASQNQSNCVRRPSACGYPDESNTGVPSGTSLARSGSITVRSPGTVVSGWDVRGTITVAANDVTIKDTRVTFSSPTGYAVFIAPGTHGTLIKDSTIGGADGGPGSVADGVLNAGDDTRAVALYIDNCAGAAWNGPGVVTDSYLITNSYRPGAHTEPIYYGGGTGLSLTVEHDTLLNPFKQTAAVFGGTDFGPQENLRVDRSLLAGGGYVIYGGSNSPATANVQITNNRFSDVYYRRGGYFGLSAYMKWSATTWRGNFWDAGLNPARG